MQYMKCVILIYKHAVHSPTRDSWCWHNWRKKVHIQPLFTSEVRGTVNLLSEKEMSIDVFLIMFIFL